MYSIVDDNSYGCLLGIPNQDCKSTFQTNVLWTTRALKDFINNWFVKKSCCGCTKLWNDDYWLPGQTGEMVNWMRLGSYKEACQVRAIGIETMIQQVDKLEALIDRLMNKGAVNQTISKFVNLKEELEKSADQKD